MIGKLTGSVGGSTLGSLLLEVGGVGYLVRMAPESVSRLTARKESVSLFTHLAVREDALDLYGFESEDELAFFQMLLSVSGIGPKSALAILSLGEVSTLQGAIAAGDASYLTKVSGVGRKSAERIVLELRDRLNKEGHSDRAHDLRGDTDALEALQSLGYTAQASRDALKQISPDILGANERLREALKVLGK